MTRPASKHQGLAATAVILVNAKTRCLMTHDLHGAVLAYLAF